MRKSTDQTPLPLWRKKERHTSLKVLKSEPFIPLSGIRKNRRTGKWWSSSEAIWRRNRSDRFSARNKKKRIWEESIMEEVTMELFRREDEEQQSQAARLLGEAFPQAYGEAPEEEVKSILLPDRIAVKAVHKGKLIGLAGAIPQYGHTGWEMHPLVVS